MAQAHNAFPTCIVCARGLTSETYIRCPLCSIDTCMACSTRHQQTHHISHSQANQQMPPHHYQSHGFQSTPQFSSPPGGSPQYPPGQDRFNPQYPPPPYQHHQFPLGGQFPPSHSFPQAQQFPSSQHAFPNSTPFMGNSAHAPPHHPYQPAPTSRRASNWIDSALNIVTRDIVRTGATLGAIANASANRTSANHTSSAGLGSADTDSLRIASDLNRMNSALRLGHRAATMSPFSSGKWVYKY